MPPSTREQRAPTAPRTPTAAPPSNAVPSSQAQPQLSPFTATEPWAAELSCSQLLPWMRTAVVDMQGCAWIELTDLKRLGRLGRGSSGDVCLYEWQGHGPVAVKWQDVRFEPPLLDAEKQPAEPRIDMRVVRSVMKEVYHHAKLDHPNIVKLHGITADESSATVGIVMEYVAGLPVMSIRLQMTPAQSLQVALGVAQGQRYLHSQSPAIAHRDLSGNNILVYKNGHAKIIDFGHSKEQKHTMLTNGIAGTTAWMAPEVLKGISGYTKECDVYSYGVLLWVLVTRQEPWAGCDVVTIIRQVNSGARLLVPDNVQAGLRDLINRCFSTQPSARPDWDEVLGVLEGLAEEGIVPAAAAHLPARLYTVGTPPAQAPCNQDRAASPHPPATSAETSEALPVAPSTPRNAQHMDEPLPAPVSNQAPAHNQPPLDKAVYLETGCGQCVDIKWSSMVWGRPIQQFTSNQTKAQQLIFQDAGDGYVYIRHEDCAIDVRHCRTEPGTPLILWRFHGGDNQKFRLEHQGDGRFRIKPKIEENLAWEVCGGSHNSFTSIRLARLSEHWCQFFSFKLV